MKNYPLLAVACTVAVCILAVIGLLTYVVIDQHYALAARTKATTMLTEQLTRDDALLSQIWGPEWKRGKEILSTPVDVTCYNSTPAQTDSSPYITGDGTRVRFGVLAISDDLRLELGLRMGQRVLLTGYGLFEIRDAMNPRWRRRVDIWLSDEKAARLHGVRKADLIWLSR